jgi:hypothetical protein
MHDPQGYVMSWSLNHLRSDGDSGICNFNPCAFLCLPAPIDRLSGPAWQHPYGWSHAGQGMSNCERV